MNSNLINIENTPTLPDIGYYNENMESTNSTDINPNSVNYSTFKTNVANSCSKVTQKGLYSSATDPNISRYIPNKDINTMDIPYYLGKQGVLMNTGFTENLINTVQSTNDKTLITNQIQYLVCQLINARNRYYSSDNFPLINDYSTVQSTFTKFGPNMKIVLALIFIITMYFLVSGFFSSFDIAANIMNILQKDSDYSYKYWVGILIGLLVPVLFLTTTYTFKIKQNLNDLQKNEITNNPYGIESTIPQSNINIDYLTLVLYILLIYAFVAVLFTIKKSSFNNLIYTILTGSIFIVLTILIYILYGYIPFFNTTEQGQMLKTGPQPLRLFIDTPTKDIPEDTSDITTNQSEDSALRKVFLLTVMAVFIITIIYFYLKSSNPFIKGFLGSSAILILPMLWVINFVIGIQYFYIYPIFLLVVRFFRYIIMLILYIATKDKSITSFSDDLVKQLENFKNYTPSWGLVGVDELKLLLNMMGYENLFSKAIIGNNDNSSSISNNKFISSGLLGFFIEKNTNGILFSVLIGVITFIISVIVLYGIVKIQN
jgi:hypothetical protein